MRDERTRRARGPVEQRIPPPPLPAGPPVLRVVPRAEPDDEPAASAEAGRPPIGRKRAPDWADVLMGGAVPRPPAVGDRPPD